MPPTEPQDRTLTPFRLACAILFIGGILALLYFQVSPSTITAALSRAAHETPPAPQAATPTATTAPVPAPPPVAPATPPAVPVTPPATVTVPPTIQPSQPLTQDLPAVAPPKVKYRRATEREARRMRPGVQKEFQRLIGRKLKYVRVSKARLRAAHRTHPWLGPRLFFAHTGAQKCSYSFWVKKIAKTATEPAYLVAHHYNTSSPRCPLAHSTDDKGVTHVVVDFKAKIESR